MVENAHGQTVQSILQDVHGKALYEVGVPDPDSLMLMAEQDDAAGLSACLEIGTDVNCTCHHHSSLHALTVAAANM